jgi:hypothetical protein
MSKEVYDEANRTMGLDESHMPDGMLAHYAAEMPDGMQIFSVFESAEALGRHAQQDVMPALARVAPNLTNIQPQVYDLHAQFTR